MQSQFLKAAYVLLARHGRPMGPKELADRAIAEGLLRDDRVGRTPWQTMKSKLSVHVRRFGERSVFVRTEPGKFDIRRLMNEEYATTPLRPPRSREKVLTFPVSWLDARDRFQGITSDWEALLRDLLDQPDLQYIDRMDAEQDDGLKQVITYVVVTRGASVLAYKRGTYSRVEDYLRGSHCIGFGGHVTEGDLSVLNPRDGGVIGCAGRELSEELQLPRDDIVRLMNNEGLHVIGVLNDDSSAVGRRHFAVVLRYDVSPSQAWDRPQRNEKAITQLRWLPAASAGHSLWDYEYWSQLCFREYFPDMPIAPAYRIVRREPLRPPHVLCVLGQVGSGKSEATTVLGEEFGYYLVNSGQVLASLMGIPAVAEETRRSFQQSAWRFISEERGSESLATAIWERIQGADSGRVLVDGIRQRRTLDSLRRLAGRRRVGVLFVSTPPDVAFKFYRGREGPAATIHDFLRLREAPVESETAGMIRDSDAVLYNWTGKVPFRDAIRRLVAEAGRHGV